MTTKEEQLSQLFESARNEMPQIPVDKIIATVDAHAISNTSLVKAQYLTLKNVLIGLVSVAFVSITLVTINFDNQEKNEATKNIEISTITEKTEKQPIQEVSLQAQELLAPEAKKRVVKKTSIKPIKNKKEIKKKEPLQLKDSIVTNVTPVDSVVDKEVAVVTELLTENDEPIIEYNRIKVMEKVAPKRRYLITENTTEMALADMVEQLKEHDVKMTYHDLKFENNKLVHFQIKIKKENDYIMSHQNFNYEDTFTYEFGWGVTEDGRFTGLFGTLYGGNNSGAAVPCDPTSSCMENRKSSKKKKRRKKKNK